MKQLKTKSIFILLLFLSLSFQNQPLKGKVIGIKDGDTIEILCNKTKIKVRLFGIDSPELNQDFGQRAKQFTSGLCFGKEVRLIPKGKDYFGRTLGEVILPDGKNLNHELVKGGMAWHFTKYSSSPLLRDFERKARVQKRGLWSHPKPVAPWEFRKTQKQKRKRVAN